MGRRWRAMALSLAFLAAGMLPARAETGVTGIWLGRFGVMTLERRGDRVVGTYGGGGIVDGTVAGNALTLHWRDRLNGDGTTHLTLRADGQALDGTLLKPDPRTGGTTWSAPRLADPPDPLGTPTHWAVADEEILPAEVGGSMSGQGTAELFFDGTKVAGRLVVRLAQAGTPAVEMFNRVAGTVAGDRMTLLCTNPDDGSTQSSDFVRDPRTGTWTAASPSGTSTLTPAASGHTETLTELAWARHARVWPAAQAGDAAAAPVTHETLAAAIARLNAGDAAGSAKAFAKLAEGYRVTSQPDGQADAMSWQASALEKLGEFEQARQLYHRILSMDGISQDRRDSAAHGLGILQLSIGGTAAPAPGPAPDVPLASDAPIVLKDKAQTAARSGDIDAAVTLYERAIAIYEANLQAAIRDEAAKKTAANAVLLNGARVDLGIALGRLTMLEWQRGRLDAAAQTLEREAAVWRGMDPAGRANLASTLGSLAMVLQRQGQLPKAIATVDEAIAIAETSHMAEPWQLYGRRAHLAAEAGDDATADGYFRKAVDNIEALRGKLVTDETKAGFFELPAGLYEDYVAFLMDHRHDPRAALDMAERSRQRALLDALGPQGGDLGPDYAFPEETPSAATAPTATADATMARARVDHVATLVYFVTRHATYAWLITPDGRMHSGRIGVDAAAVAAAVTAFRTPVVSGEAWDQPRRSLTRLLSEPVTAPLADLPEGTRLTVVPHKRLAMVPFAALGETPGAWGKRWIITALPSLSIGGQLPRTAVPRNGPLLAVGAPAGSEGLVFSRDEVTRTAALFPGATVLLDAKSSRQQVLADLPRARLALLSTHTRQATPDVAGRRPELELVLAGADRLGRRDLKRGSLSRMGLVVLSACDTGDGPQLGGDELMNLARAFLVAGAERVLITLWDVEDKASTDIVVAFLAALRSGTPPAAALQRVQTAYAGRLRPDGTPMPPATWAPFVLVGRND